MEASIALCGMALEEEGHAKVLEGFVAEETGVAPVDRDSLVTWEDWPLLGDTSGQRQETWPEALLAYFCQDVQTTAALHALARSSVTRLADRARKMVQEEAFHQVFVLETVGTLAEISPVARQVLKRDLTMAHDTLSAGGEIATRVAEAVEAEALPVEAGAAYDQHLAEGRSRVQRLLESS
jgi:1,2-phenylacetyl-CoA epoxidase catalytic subunit